MFVAVLAAAVLAAADPGAKVYFGTLQNAKKPAEITAQLVFDKIPEFQKIKERGLNQDDPEYIILLNKANAKFYAAIARAAAQGGCDVVVEKGSAPFSGDVVNLTQKVIDALE